MLARQSLTSSALAASGSGFRCCQSVHVRRGVALVAVCTRELESLLSGIGRSKGSAASGTFGIK